MGTLQKLDVPEYLCGENQWETLENINLFNAASEGNINKLKEALSNGANPNYISKQNEQLGALHAAARSLSSSENGAALCARELIGNGARASCRSISDKNEPIHEAASAGNEQVVKVLVESSPKCTSSENAFGNTALHAATRSGSPDIVKLLLEKGAQINKQNHRGSSALHIACFLSKSEGSNGDSTSIDPYLKIAAILLCNDELDIDIKDVNGYTPLHVASQRGANEIVKLLIDSGASLTAKTAIDSKGRGNRTAAGMAKFGGHSSTLKIIESAMSGSGSRLHLSVTTNEQLKVNVCNNKLAALKILE